MAITMHTTMTMESNVENNRIERKKRIARKDGEDRWL
jgi:hypothetical protein